MCERERERERERDLDQYKKVCVGVIPLRWCHFALLEFETPEFMPKFVQMGENTLDGRKSLPAYRIFFYLREGDPANQLA